MQSILNAESRASEVSAVSIFLRLFLTSFGLQTLMTILLDQYMISRNRLSASTNSVLPTRFEIIQGCYLYINMVIPWIRQLTSKPGSLREKTTPLQDASLPHNVHLPCHQAITTMVRTLPWLNSSPAKSAQSRPKKRQKVLHSTSDPESNFPPACKSKCSPLQTGTLCLPISFAVRKSHR